MEKSWEHSSHEWHRGGQGTTADKFKHVPVELSTTSRAWTVVKHSNLANWMMNWSKTYWISDVPRLLCVHLVSTRFAICDPLFPFTIHRVPYLSLIYLYIRGVGCERDKLTFHSIASAQGYTRSMQKQYITNSSSVEFCWGALGCSCSWLLNSIADCAVGRCSHGQWVDSATHPVGQLRSLCEALWQGEWSWDIV